MDVSNMSDEKAFIPERVYQQLTRWLADIKQHEVSQLVELIEQAKSYVKAAEALPEERINQFIENLKYDLSEFYYQLKHDSKNSVYLGLLRESWWSAVAQMTDKSQVEWGELTDDFAHQGHYHTGDYIGFGELICKHCQHSITITHNTKVLDCTSCGGQEFSRQGLTP